MNERPTHHNAHGSSTGRYHGEQPGDHSKLEASTFSSGDARNLEHVTTIEALVRLANDSKASTRTVAVTELERLISRAAESPDLHAAIEGQIPQLAATIHTTTDLETVTDLLRLAGEFGRLAAYPPARSCVGGLSSRERSSALHTLASVILAKLYESNRPLPESVAEGAVIALASFPESAAAIARPLLSAFERVHPANTRISHCCDVLRRIDDERSAANPPRTSSLSSLATFMGFRGLLGRLRWSSAESAAVETLIGTFNAPPALPPPSDPASSYLLAMREQRIRESIQVLGRFGARNKAELEPNDSVRAAVALSTCLSSPLHHNAAIAALAALGRGALTALPALIEVANSQRSSNSTRGDALEAIARILATSPDIDCSDTRGLGGRFFESASRALHSSNPLLVQKGLEALALIGERGGPLASAIEYALCNDLDATPSPGENEDAALQPVALYAIEALGAIDRSGHTAAQAFTRIFDIRRTPDDIRQQLIVAVGELAEREEITVRVVDAITARILDARHLPEYLAEEALAMVQRVEQTLDLHPAEMPRTTIALLRSRTLDTLAKEGLLSTLVSKAEIYRQAVLDILIEAYPALSPVARLDDIALEALRKLHR